MVKVSTTKSTVDVDMLVVVVVELHTALILRLNCANLSQVKLDGNIDWTVPIILRSNWMTFRLDCADLPQIKLRKIDIVPAKCCHQVFSCRVKSNNYNSLVSRPFSS